MALSGKCSDLSVSKRDVELSNLGMIHECGIGWSA